MENTSANNFKKYVFMCETMLWQPACTIGSHSFLSIFFNNFQRQPMSTSFSSPWCRLSKWSLFLEVNRQCFHLLFSLWPLPCAKMHMKTIVGTSRMQKKTTRFVRDTIRPRKALKKFVGETSKSETLSRWSRTNSSQQIWSLWKVRRMRAYVMLRPRILMERPILRTNASLKSYGISLTTHAKAFKHSMQHWISMDQIIWFTSLRVASRPNVKAVNFSDHRITCLALKMNWSFHWAMIIFSSVACHCATQRWWLALWSTLDTRRKFKWILSRANISSLRWWT